MPKTANMGPARTVGKSVGMSVGKSIGKSVGKSVGKSAGKSVGKSAGKSIGKSIGKRTITTDAAAVTIGKTPEPKVSQVKPKTKPTHREKYNKWSRTVNKLAEAEPKKFFSYAVTKRIIQKYLCENIEYISSEALAILNEALLSYMHSFYEDGYHSAVTSGRRTTLMVRDVHAVYQAKGEAVVVPRA